MQHLRFFHSKSFTLLQQNKSAFTTNLLPSCNRTKALSQQIFYPFATEPKRFHSKNKRSEATKQKLLNAKTHSSSALKR